jgi:hypothetical protein
MAWEDELLRELLPTSTHEQIGILVGRGARAVRNRCHAIGAVQKRFWTEAELDQVREAYSASLIASEVDLPGLAARLNRSKADVCDKAGAMGLTDKSRPRIPAGDRKARTAKFESDEARRLNQSEVMKRTLAERGHPKGMAGKAHTSATKAVIAEKSRASAARMSPEQKSANALKAMKTREANGTPFTERATATWKAGWREIGGIRKFYRSRWEANYARYLEWLRSLGEIMAWAHEPKTFWFEGVRRGAVSYLPDFWVREANGREAFHEVKGWMDDRSKTKLRRMTKYHPEVRIVVIRAKQYHAIERKVRPLIPDWETQTRRTS